MLLGLITWAVGRKFHDVATLTPVQLQEMQEQREKIVQKQEQKVSKLVQGVYFKFRILIFTLSCKPI